MAQPLREDDALAHSSGLSEEEGFVRSEGAGKTRWSSSSRLAGVAGLLLATAAVAGVGRGLRPSTAHAESQGLPVRLYGEEEEEYREAFGVAYPAPPSLFCFTVMRTSEAGGQNEVRLIKAQFQHRSSLFACEEAAVLCSGCNGKVSLGYGKDGEAFSWETPLPAAEVGKGWSDWSYLNAGVFIQAWDSLIKSGRLWDHDWTVKVDPDAVYFPDRLRLHLISYQGHNIYFTNCDSDEFRKSQPGGPKGARMFGALEVFSKRAIQTYQGGKAKCEARDYASMPEDYYMQTCMDVLGVTSQFDDALVSDPRCYAAACDDWTRVSFHPYRDVDPYFSCLGQASR